MPTLRKTLNELHHYHRLLVVGGRWMATLIMGFALGTEVLYLVNAHIADERQNFTSAHRLVQGRINAVEQAFLYGLVRAEMASGDELDTARALIRQFRANGNLLRWRPFPSEPVEMLIAGAPHTALTDAQLVRAFAFATQIGRANVAVQQILERPPSQIFFTADGSVVAIVPASHVVNAARLATEAGRRQFVHELTDGAATLALRPPDSLLQERPRAYWVPRLYAVPSGRQVLQLASPVVADNRVMAVLVSEVEPGNLTWPIADGHYDGTYAIVTDDGAVVASASRSPNAAQALAAASHWKRTHAVNASGLTQTQRDGCFVLARPLGTSGFSLVYTYTWRDVASAVAGKALAATAIALALLATIWLLLFQLNRRVFAPMYHRSEQVFDSERLSRTMIETVPVGIGLVSTASGKLLNGGSELTALAERIEGGMPHLLDVLLRRYRLRAASPHVSHDEVFQEDVSLRTLDGSDLALQARFAEGRYLGENVLVTAFFDMTTSRRLQLQLGDAKRAADQANAAKSAFLAAMSHEIRTPLNAILGNLELLGHSPLNPLQRDRLDTIRSSSNGLLAIIEDVLDFSKIEAGEMQLEHLRFDVTDVITRALAMFAPVARAKQVALHGQFLAALDQPMRGDAGRLAQVVHNLLSNAIKFTEQGRVTLRTSIAAERGGLFVIEVIDTGIGIDEAQRARLFSPFVQADSSISRRFGGTGLGLALCQRLTVRMGGMIEAASTAGEGSCFTVRVPLDALDPGSLPIVRTPPTLHGARVTLLATDEAVQASLTPLLGSWGATVEPIRHPDAVADGNGRVLLICGDRSGWSPAAENRLVEECAAVINASDEGPLHAMRLGRMLTVSSHAPAGLRAALEHLLNGAPLAPAAGALPPGAAPARPLGLHVLVAEDNDVNRRLLAEQLAVLGCRAYLVADGIEALEALSDTRYDVVLTDLNMPRMDGYTLATIVRERWPHTPIVAVTADVTLDERQRCAALGLHTVASKPLSLTALARILRELAGQGEAGCETEAVRTAHADDEAPLGGRPLSPDIVVAFRAACAKSIGILNDAALRGDAPALLAELHSLKGALGIFRRRELAQQCLDLEQRIESSGIHGAREALQALTDALAALSTGDVQP